MRSPIKFRVCILAITLLCGYSLLNATSPVYEKKRQEYLDTEGSKLSMYFHEKVWAWLEKSRLGLINPAVDQRADIDGVKKPVKDIFHNIIQCWGKMYTGPEGTYPKYDTAWRWGEWYTSVTCIWILLKYGEWIYPADKSFLQNLYANHTRSTDFSPGSENSRLADMVGRYLWSQYDLGASVQYSYNPPPNENIYTFTQDGNTYSPGQVYSAFNLSRDWLFFMLNKWLREGNAELDSPNYTWTFVLAIMALSEFSVDEKMANRARMFLDFLMLESVLDFSGNQWGGALGRTYTGTIYGGDSRFYWDLFWNEIPSAHDPSMAVLLASKYVMPDIIYDIGDLSDEPDNYHHINMEYNYSIVTAPGTGKWTYVTKFFNLGGKVGNGWQLNIKSTDVNSYQPSRPGVPFRLWINDTYGVDSESPVAYEAYCNMGINGYQYKNAMFIKGAVLHYAILDHAWDKDEKADYYSGVNKVTREFFKEGRTMLAVILRPFEERTAGLEVAIEGVDYASFDEFKNAIITKASLDNYNYYTSRGDKISYDKLSNNSNIWVPAVWKKDGSGYQSVWPFQFPRIQTQDWRGQWIVKWLNGIMTVTKHGKQRIYDFNAWTWKDQEVTTDTQAPASPTGLKVSGN